MNKHKYKEYTNKKNVDDDNENHDDGDDYYDDDDGENERNRKWKGTCIHPQRDNDNNKRLFAHIKIYYTFLRFHSFACVYLS